MMRPLFISAALAFFTAPAFADQTSGTILAYDRLANIIVLTDKSYWTINDKTLVPADLAAGDKVQIVFTSDGDNGIGKVSELKRQD
jgi:hypothetical protein